MARAEDAKLGTGEGESPTIDVRCIGPPNVGGVVASPPPVETFAALQGWDGGLKLSGARRCSWVGTQRRRHLYCSLILCDVVFGEMESGDYSAGCLLTPNHTPGPVSNPSAL